jgi:hypothetical protein
VEWKEEEFHNCKQEGKTVGNYAAKFTRLSTYCPLLVQAESHRVQRFIKGLCPELKRALVGMGPSTYNISMEIASRIEDEDLEKARQRNKKGLNPLLIRGQVNPNSRPKTSTPDRGILPPLGTLSNVIIVARKAIEPMIASSTSSFKFDVFDVARMATRRMNAHSFDHLYLSFNLMAEIKESPEGIQELHEVTLEGED